jgi:Asp-tRNA(Asn)/Glu-tRNA(Gln) amidotransferase A subunit family amidase
MSRAKSKTATPGLWDPGGSNPGERSAPNGPWIASLAMTMLVQLRYTCSGTERAAQAAILDAMQSNRSEPMKAPDATKPRMQPFLPRTADFTNGKDSPRAFLERCIAEFYNWEPRISAFVSLNLEAARTAADSATERWRAGKPLSPIDGMPIGIKDIIETIDMPTENGSPLFAGFRGQRDSASVAALREAGGVILGKTVTTEFAWMHPRATRNPWDPARTPGGSSSGSAAAVAVGAISVGIGTQVFGSIVRPSSFCGCFGFKPTVGAINRGGSHDALSQSTHGPIAASLPEAW